MKKDDRHKTLGYKTVFQKESRIYSGVKKEKGRYFCNLVCKGKPL